jgi:hypothetical protein
MTNNTQSPKATKVGPTFDISRSVRYSRHHDKILKIIAANRNKETPGTRKLVVSDLIREAIEQFIQNNAEDTGSRRSLKRANHNHLTAIRDQIDDIHNLLTDGQTPAADSTTVLQILQALHLYTITLLHLQAATLIPLLHKTGTAQPPTPESILTRALQQAWTDQTVPAITARLFQPEDPQS